MATRTESRGNLSNGERPDTLYAFVAGLYVAILLTPIAILGISTVSVDGGILYMSYLGFIALFTAVAGWLISHTAGLAVRLGHHDLIWLLVAVPFVPFVGVFAASEIGISPPSIAIVLAMVTMIGGMFTSLPLVTMSRNRYTTAAVANTTEITEWEGRWPQWWRQISYGAMIIAILGGSAGIIAHVVFGVEWAGNLYLLMVFWAPLAGSANPRTFRVTDAGLVVHRPLLHRFRPWIAFTGYSLNDEALVIYRKGWWRQNIRCDRDDIEDVDAAIAALDTVIADCTRSSSREI
ncbi:hypothetical protein SAMN05421858_3050 [Haladaptatus litoreus]|uniref:Uncharacterized protein n=2 Tax=Haladaptatus litoreus TaxID=553468 RepID=A0A1N7CJJ6_9EURY|nr:hypothetical protein SAMN05421858_3050 [Haladaptatus litoreus]